MGFENRDYTRDGSYTRGGASFLDDAPMCKRILMATIIVFVAQLFLTRPANLSDVQPQIDQLKREFEEEKRLYGYEADFEEYYADAPELSPEFFLQTAPAVSIVQNWLELDTDKVLKSGQIWRLVTTAFCHDRFGVFHILFNMLFLYWFGRFVETTYGSREFLVFYLAAAVIASLAFIGLELFTGDRHPAIGASGAVMAVVCVFAMWNPDHRINLYFLFPIPIRLLLLIYVVYDLHPVLLALAGEATYTGVAHAAHLGGLLFGFLYYKNDWRLAPWWAKVTRYAGDRKTTANAKRSGLGIFTGTPSLRNDEQKAEKTMADIRFDEQLDEVLKKISEHGQDSLTERERKVLIRGSQRYRNQ